MADISKDTLMFVDDPKEAIEAIFKHKEKIITNDSYTEIYKKIKGISDVGQTKAETHLGTLRIYGLVEPDRSSSKGNNKLSTRGIWLKELWEKENDWNKNEPLRKALSDILLTNGFKGELFENFKSFVERAKTMAEIKKKYKWRTADTLVAWCEFVGWVEKKEKGYVVIKKEKKPTEFSMNELWCEVKESYQEIRILGYDKKRLFIRVSDLRLRCSINLNLDNPFEFDEHFRNLLQSEYGKFINLHGTLVGEYSEREDFRYKGRLYPFVSIVM